MKKLRKDEMLRRGQARPASLHMEHACGRAQLQDVHQCMHALSANKVLLGHMR